MSKRIIETGRFETTSPKGESFTVIEETQQTGFTALGSSSTKWRDGSKSYRTSNNEPVNWISDREFELVLTGERLHLT